MRGLTSTQGSQNGFRLEDVASVIPVGGPRKLSQTSRRRDSSASLHSKNCLLSQGVPCNNRLCTSISKTTRYFMKKKN